MSAAETHRYFQDVDGTQVSLLARVWNRHILFQHPEMLNNEFAISQALVSPDQVSNDRDSQYRRIYYRKGVVRGFETEFFLKVVVEYSDNMWGERQGTIITAYVVKEIPKEEP